ILQKLFALLRIVATTQRALLRFLYCRLERLAHLERHERSQTLFLRFENLRRGNQPARTVRKRCFAMLLKCRVCACNTRVDFRVIHFSECLHRLVCCWIDRCNRHVSPKRVSKKEQSEHHRRAAEAERKKYKTELNVDAGFRRASVAPRLCREL